MDLLLEARTIRAVVSQLSNQEIAMKTLVKLSAAVIGVALSMPLLAQTVDVKDAWARSTVQGQKASGAFMKLTAKEGTKLVGGSSPVAGVVDVGQGY